MILRNESSYFCRPNDCSAPRTTYFVLFAGWDGKEIELQSEWVENLYTKDELQIGKELNLPWPGKGCNVTYWNAVVVDGSSKVKKAESGMKRKAPSTPQKKKKVETCYIYYIPDQY